MTWPRPSLSEDRRNLTSWEQSCFNRGILLLGRSRRERVVDGQQRLTTIQLLLDAIQEFCMEAGFDDSAARLNGLSSEP